ncbi:MAG TPA: DUF192 domain-containing protein [Candidatus Baltobacteraceae bacterium]|jgi:hypothetical protein|nr:DUF192 domain-containing protein [Candidatus Baltobacteraceae bacterium]
MKLQQLRNLRTGAVIAGRVSEARDFFSRGLGLLPRKHVARDEGLWIRGCSSVHTMGMRAIIDLYFLDRENRVLHFVHGARPNRPYFSYRKAHSVLELGWDENLERNVALGDQLALE